MAWQGAQQIANPRARVHRQLWGFHPVTSKPCGQGRCCCSSLLHPAAFLPVFFTALCSPGGEEDPHPVHPSPSTLTLPLSCCRCVCATPREQMGQRRAGTAPSTSLCSGQQVPPCQALRVSSCHSCPHRLGSLGLPGRLCLAQG